MSAFIRRTSVPARAFGSTATRPSFAAVAFALVVTLLAAFFVSTPAMAAPASPDNAAVSPLAAAEGSLRVVKRVNDGKSADVLPGGEFTYSIEVGCDDADCIDAELTDVIPAQFDGFEILSSSVTPPSLASTKQLTGCDTAVTASCTLNVAFEQSLDGGMTGIPAGDTYRVFLTLKAPQSLTADWAFNALPIENTATATASNVTNPAFDTATVTVTVAPVIAVETSKTWQPAAQQFAPGTPSTIAVGATNASNLPASSLSIQDPKNAPDGATKLDASNPFTVTDFAGLGTVVKPAGTTAVQIDVYRYDEVAQTWSWVLGTPQSEAVLAADAGVGGIRVTFMGDALLASGASGSVQIGVKQRAENRNDGSQLLGGATLTNVTEGSVTVPGHDVARKQATAPYAIGALTVAVEAGKSISPSRLPAGTIADATLSAKNTSNGPLTELTIADLDFFTNDLKFAGFTQPITVVAGATAAHVVWHFSDGSTASVSFASGTQPVAPAAPTGAHLTGFEIVFVGDIPAGASATINAGILPTVDLVDENGPAVKKENTVIVTGKNSAGSASAEKKAELTIYYPDIKLSLNKKVRPGGAVQPGAGVVAQLETTTASDSAYVNPTAIVVTDQWRNAEKADFWNAFNPTAIAPTQIFPNTTLTIEYFDGSSWKPLTAQTAGATATLFSTDIDAALAPLIQGFRFTFTNAAGFAQGTTVSPNVAFAARATLRDGSGATSVSGEAATKYTNIAVAQGSGTVFDGLTVESDPVTADDVAQIQTDANSGVGVGSVNVDKRWIKTNNREDLTSLPSQSGASARTLLGWGAATPGFTSVVISDPAGGEASPATTTFQAFNLTAIGAVSYADDPQLKWDAVSAVELYYSGAWNVVQAPTGGWMGTSGFVGYPLTATESAETTGVRITITENSAARSASTDPMRPAAGTGVATSPFNSVRPLLLSWQLRNVLRVIDAATPANRWATAGQRYNDTEEGALWNSVDVEGFVSETESVRKQASDNISLIDMPPGVDVTKSVSPAQLAIPHHGDAAPADYPRASFVITAENTSTSRASYLRVTEPLLCGDSEIQLCVTDATAQNAPVFAGASYDATTNPFERLNATQLTFVTPSAEIDRDASVVTLWLRDSDGVLTAQDHSITDAQTLSAAQLAGVVGVSVVYQGATPITEGGSIRSGSKATLTIATQLRPTLRSDDAAFVEPFTISNTVMAQSYDPVMYPSGTASAPYKVASAGLTLLQGKLDIVASKSLSPASILERDRANPIAVMLGANQGNATVAPQQVQIEDVDLAFWNSVNLSGTALNVTLPAGADQVRVEVRTGANTWTVGLNKPSAELPQVNPADVTGIRFVFSKANGGVFSASVPPANWNATASFSVTLRGSDRATGAAIPFPGTLSDEITTVSERIDATTVLFPAHKANADDSVVLATGTHRLNVAKAPAGNIHTVEPLSSNLWTLSLENTGTGYLTVDRLVDTLPNMLTWNGQDPSYATSSGGTLSTDVSTAYDAGTRALTFTWPDGGQRMAPGEKFTISLDIALEAGLIASERATNAFIVTTAQALAACTNTSGNGQGLLAGLAANECGTSNYVQPQGGGLVAGTKWVKGEVDGDLVDGAADVRTPGRACVLDAEGFSRFPCAADTVLGATDQWKVQAINSGTIEHTSLTIVDPLPHAGDRMLATGATRNSSYRPIFDRSYGLNIVGVDAAAMSYEVTTSANACVGSGASSTWQADGRCTNSPATAAWSPAGAFAGDWEDVTALRITFDFSQTAAGVLPPGGVVTVRYQTVNAPASAASLDRAPVVVPVADAIAWNQAGFFATLVGGQSVQRAPIQAGVRMATGALQISKQLGGAAAAYAAEEFTADVSCVAAGIALDLGAQSALMLNAANGFTHSIDGIPLGAECAVSEQGAVGSFGETSRLGDNAVVSILTPSTSALVPTAQQIAITNVYEFGALAVTKAVNTLATVGSFGPFGFSLQCTASTGIPVVLDASDSSFTLANGETHAVTENTIPQGANCTLEETQTGGADSIIMTADAATTVVNAGAATAEIVIAEASDVTVSNGFEAGTLALRKVLTGTGAGKFGKGPFYAGVECRYGTPAQTLFTDDRVQIFADRDVVLQPVFPVGTQCSVIETITGGANAHENPRAVVIAGPASGSNQPTGAVTAAITNTFTEGSLSIVKQRTGDGIDEFGAGPFAAQAVCTWERNGESLLIPLEGGGIVTLAPNDDKNLDYRAMIDHIIVGAQCAVVETDAGMAVATTLSPADGIVTILDPAEAQKPAAVTITNRFDVGQLEITKVADSSTIMLGESVSYRITVANTGQIDATDAVVTDTLPAGARFVSASAAGVSAAGNVTWKLPLVAKGTSTVLSLVVSYAEAGSYVNVANVVSPPGPWREVPAIERCTEAQACASISVKTPPAVPSTPSGLASTGVEAGVMAGLAVFLLVLGSGMVLIYRRRRAGRHS